MKIENLTAQVIQFLAFISCGVGAILIIISLGDFSQNVDKILLGIGCIVEGIFMFGFSYVVEACAIYIKKNHKDDVTKKYFSGNWNQRLKEEEDSK